MSNEARDLLRRLAANDGGCLRTNLVASPGPGTWPGPTGGLSRRSRELVRLAALLAVDAPTSSLRWAVELACAAGVDDYAVVGVLAAAASVTGSAQVVLSAPRLALALDLEPAQDGNAGER